MIILGDFNTNVLKKDNAGHKSFTYFCNLFDLHQLIQEPTRVSTSSQTIIDLILVSDKLRIASSGVTGCCLSDHFGIYCTRKLRKPLFGCHNTVKMRSLKNYNKEAFIESLNKKDWSQVLHCDVDNAWDHFKTMLTEVVDSLAPIKMVRIKQISQPWFNDAISKGIMQRNKLFAFFKKNRTEQAFSDYKKCRHKVYRNIVSAKKGYFNDKILENKNKPQDLWKIVKQLGYSNKSNNKSSSLSLDIGDKISAEKSEVADSLNTYFTSIAKTLGSKLPITTGFFGESCSAVL